MGRYDGEYYDYGGRNCGVGHHDVQMNGSCHTCGRQAICSYCVVGEHDRCHLTECECLTCGVVVVRRGRGSSDR